MTREEAINEIKSWDFLNGKEFEAIQTLIPELRKSEDERIREALVEYFSQPEDIDTIQGVRIEKVRAWLEKQKEQKSTTIPERIRPKFSVGDTVCRNGYVDHTVIEIYLWKDPVYVCKNDEGLESHISFSEQDKWEKKEQKPVRCLKAERDKWYICIKDFYAGGKKCASTGELIQAKGGMYMMGREDISEWFRKAYYDEIKSAEWSEEDEKMTDNIVSVLGQYIDYKSVSGTGSGYATPRYAKEIDWLKSIRPQPRWKPSEEQMAVLLNAEGLMRANDYKENAKILAGLYNDLKKL